MKYLKLRLPSKKSLKKDLTQEIHSNTNSTMKKELLCNTKKLNDILSVRFNKEELARIDAVCELNGIKRATLIRIATIQYISTRKKK